MGSAEHSSAEHSLVLRVGWTAAICAVLASFVTLLVAILVTDQQVIAEAESDLLDLASALCRELDDEEHAHDGTQELEEEIGEFARQGILIAVDRGGALVGGSPELPANATEGCRVQSALDESWLVCMVTGHTGFAVRVGEPQSLLLAHRGPLLLGGVSALLFVALLSVLGGFVVARWLLRPLTQLQAALEKVALSTGTVAPLPRSNMVEVDVFAAALDELVARLSEEVLRSQQFAADAAHELRTPLTKLRTEMELLLENYDAGSDEALRLSRVVARTDGLSQLVERLLVLASPHAALKSPTLVSLGAAVETLADDLAPGRIEVSVSDDGMVLGDAAVLSAMVRNALDNALKFSKGTVRASVTQEGDNVLLRVDDTGPGVPPEQRATVFQRFARGANQHGTPGHGIGLALIAHIVAAHDGSVRFVDGPPGAHLEIRLLRHLGA